MFLVNFLRDWARGRTANSLSLPSLSPLLTYQRGVSILFFFFFLVLRAHLFSLYADAISLLVIREPSRVKHFSVLGLILHEAQVRSDTFLFPH